MCDKAVKNFRLVVVSNYSLSPVAPYDSDMWEFLSDMVQTQKDVGSSLLC